MKRGKDSASCVAAPGRRRFRRFFRVAQAGMSLIELLMVVAILLILTVLYWGQSKPSRQQREKLACQQNLRSIHMALLIYANGNGGKFPALAGATNSAAALDLLVPLYTVDTPVFICPASKDPPLPAGESIRKHKISYAYYMGRREGETPEVLMTDQQVDTLSKTSGQVLFSTSGQPPGNNHDERGGNLLFSDGHTEWCAPRAPSSLVLTQGVVLLNP